MLTIYTTVVYTRVVSIVDMWSILELELDASVDPSHQTDDHGEES